MESSSSVLFEVYRGFLIPRLPVLADGTPRVPDGSTLLSEDQAAERFSTSVEVIRDLYAHALGETQTPTDVERLLTTPAVVTDEGRRTSLALRAKFGHLADEFFFEFIRKCEGAGVNPWVDDVFPEQEIDEKTGRRKLILACGINHMRRVAAADPRYRGQRGPTWCNSAGEWCDVWLFDAPPAACRVGVVLAGDPEPTPGIATWRNYAVRGDDGEVLSSWAEKGDIRLAAVAEACALRRAFGDRLGGFYTHDELAQRRNPRRRVVGRVLPPREDSGEKANGLRFVPDDPQQPEVVLDWQ